MKFFPIFLCLAVIYCTYSVVILQSSTTSTKIVSPAGAYAYNSSYYNSLHKNIAGAGVFWLSSSYPTSPTRYQALFYSSCTGSANLTITAASFFYVYFDGVYIGYGYNQSVAFKFPLKMTCNNHNLTIYNYFNSTTYDGITYSINQDQSKCYNCQVTGYWSEYACQCFCIAPYCSCQSPKVWKTYPVCGCGCPVTFIPIFYSQPTAGIATDSAKGNTTQKAVEKKPEVAVNGSLKKQPDANKTQKAAPPEADKQAGPNNTTVPPPAKASGSATANNTASLKIFHPVCVYPKYFSQATCSCVCHTSYCPDGYYFNQKACQCYSLLK